MKLSENEIENELAKLEGWKKEGIAIKKTFSTGSFIAGTNFLNKIAGVAEKINHHPDVFLTYQNITFLITTHSEGGLTEKDFELAEMIDEVYDSDGDGD